MSLTPARIEETVASYVAAWNERDSKRRATLLEQCLSEDVAIAFAGREIRGPAAVEAEIAEYHRSMPNARARLSTVVESHGNVCRFAAVVELPDGSVFTEVVDVCECDSEGRLRRIITFAGVAPARLD